MVLRFFKRNRHVRQQVKQHEAQNPNKLYNLKTRLKKSLVFFLFFFFKKHVQNFFFFVNTEQVIKHQR